MCSSDLLLYLLRCRRIKQLFLLIEFIFLYTVYKLFFFSDIEDARLSELMLFLFMQSPCFVLGQYLGAVELNYYPVLLTKPVRINFMLKNKYYFFNLLSTLNLCLCIPLLLFSKIDLITLFSLWFYVIGTNVWILFVFAIPKKRLDLHTSVLFNSQGFSFPPL